VRGGRRKQKRRSIPFAAIPPTATPLHGTPLPTRRAPRIHEGGLLTGPSASEPARMRRQGGRASARRGREDYAAGAGGPDKTKPGGSEKTKTKIDSNRGNSNLRESLHGTPPPTHQTLQIHEPALATSLAQRAGAHAPPRRARSAPDAAGRTPGAGRAGRRKRNTTDSNRRHTPSLDASPRYSSSNTANAFNL